MAFHKRLGEAFLAIARREPDRCVVIDADAAIDAVWAEVLARRVHAAWASGHGRAASSAGRVRHRGRRGRRTAALDALDRGRLHHAWLLTGAEGVGKATFAYRVAAPPAGRAARSGLRGPGLGADPTSSAARSPRGRIPT